MKRKRRKFNIKRIVLFLLTITFAIYLYINNIDNSSNSITTKVTDTSKYQTIKQDANSNYSGIGQEKIDNKDGYFTTFTTSEKYRKVYKDYKQDGNFSWSNNEYWGGTMSDNGCGITAIATILSGYNKNYTPEDLRKKYFPVLDNTKISQELSKTFGLKNTDFYYDSLHISTNSLKEHLKSNRPILICVWNKPNENRWTTSSHYMVLLATDGDDMVYIANPNGGENNSKSSGWYEFNEVTPYIAKALYIESY